MPSSRLIPFFAVVSLATGSAFAAVPIPNAPAFDARAYVLLYYQSGRILDSKEPDVHSEPDDEKLRDDE